MLITSSSCERHIEDKSAVKYRKRDLCEFFNRRIAILNSIGSALAAVQIHRAIKA